MLAVGAGSPLARAAIMFAFILRTTPMFFGPAYTATRLGEALHARFLQLMGSPNSFSNITAAAPGALSSASSSSDTVPAEQPDPDANVTVSGFNAEKSLTLHLVTGATPDCTRPQILGPPQRSSARATV